MIHLCNNFVSSRVHSELIHNISELGFDQYVLVPVRRALDVSKNNFVCDRVKIEYVLYSNKVVRFFPFIKIVYVFFKLYSFLKLHAVNDKDKGEELCLAHNFWSDGMVLFLFSFFVDIRYALVVRNTDINIFIPRLPHYRWLMKWAIRRSQGVVFISQAHHKRFASEWPSLLQCASNVSVIPNGTSEFWHSQKIANTQERPVRACFVGRFVRNKNLHRVLLATERIVKDLPDFRLMLVGGSVDELRELLGGTSPPSFVDVLGHINDKKQIMNVYRTCRVFVMPSLKETFGLVYLEAISQGCAVVCTRNEGIDGLFDSTDVVAIDPLSITEIEQGIRVLLQSNSKGLDPKWVSSAVQPFQWKRVARQYLAVFK